VKRYVREPGSAQVGRWVRDARLFTSRLTFVEVASAAARMLRSGEIHLPRYHRVRRALDSDAALFETVELDGPVAATATDLLGGHALRAADAVQLASCLSLTRRFGAEVEFVCFDQPLGIAAREEGLRVLGG